MNKATDIDPVISHFISNWGAGKALIDYHFGEWSYEESMYAIYRMGRYLSMSANLDNLKRGCEGGGCGKDGYSFISEHLLGEDWNEHVNEAMTLKCQCIKLKMREGGFLVDAAKHAIISNPWDRRRISQSSMLMSISNPKHDFYQMQENAADNIYFDLVLPWGIFVVSNNGNHRAMAMVLSGTGVIPSEFIERVYDFEPIFNLPKSNVLNIKTPFGDSVHKLAALMKDVAKHHGRYSEVDGIDPTWLMSY